MKTLLLLRHGKSDWDADYETDHDRPLAKRGQAAASLMGKFLVTLRQIPDQVVSSSAVRAHDTVRLATEAGDWSCPVNTTRKLYGVPPENVLNVIRGCDDSKDRVLVAGHEPTLSELAGGLIGQASIKFPTGAISRIDLAIESWKDADFRRGTLVWLLTPKLLGKIGLTGKSSGQR
jgi:phosphohistidine phosphatase